MAYWYDMVCPIPGSTTNLDMPCFLFSFFFALISFFMITTRSYPSSLSSFFFLLLFFPICWSSPPHFSSSSIPSRSRWIKGNRPNKAYLSFLLDQEMSSIIDWSLWRQQLDEVWAVETPLVACPWWIKPYLECHIMSPEMLSQWVWTICP